MKFIFKKLEKIKRKFLREEYLKNILSEELIECHINKCNDALRYDKLRIFPDDSSWSIKHIIINNER